MDEEDGRPGPQARKFVAFDVQMDAFTKSLRPAFSISQQNTFHSALALHFSAFRRAVSTQPLMQINFRAFFPAWTCRRRLPHRR